MSELHGVPNVDNAVPVGGVLPLEAETSAPRLPRFRRFFANRGSVIALAWIAILIVIAIFASVISQYNPTTQDLRHAFQGPSGLHWLGTDDLGRDVFSRLAYGSRISLRVSFEVVGLALVFAIPTGLMAGYRGGQVDNIVMRVMDGGLSFPPLVLALAVISVLGPGVNNAALAIAAVFMPSFARLIRGQALAVKEEAFIEASRSLGTPSFLIVSRRVFPNVLGAIVVQASLALGSALLAEAALSFLGLGAQPPSPSWGSMLQEAYSTGVFSHPWGLVTPGATIALAVLGFNSVGDGLSEALGVRRSDKRHVRRGRRGGYRRGLTHVEPDRLTRAQPASGSSRRENGSAPSLVIEGLNVSVTTSTGSFPVVQDVELSVEPGETLGLVGESGSGKTVTSLAIMRLLPSPPFTITRGRIWVGGQDLLDLSFDEMRQVRGRQVSMIFQDPMTSLNPARTVGSQLVETIRLHQDVSRQAARRHAVELLERVGIPDSEVRTGSFPHQLSGGMRQRVMIAMALSCHPRLLIADEPTTALDVTVQAQILELLRDLSQSEQLGVIFVTHDLAVVSQLCDRVAVMYAGELVETAVTSDLFKNPRHPYTAGLIGASRAATGDRSVLPIPGQVPDIGQMPEGCRFHPRCHYATTQCWQTHPGLQTALIGPSETSVVHDEGSARTCRCWRQDELTLKGIS